MGAICDSQRDRAVELLEGHGIMRLSELKRAGIHSETLNRLVAEGMLLRPSRGVYQLADAEVDAFHGFAEVAMAAPKAIICLISALQFHDLTLQRSPVVWIAVKRGHWAPKIRAPRTRIAYFGEKAMGVGVERHLIDGVSVPIFSPAKTVVDCFRYRNVVGFDVAMEGLGKAVRSRKAHPDDIAAIAQQTRAWSVVRPYLDAILANEG